MDATSAEMPQPGWTVHETITRRPATATVFVRLGMACVGCIMAPFETLEEAAAAYRLSPDLLVGELLRAGAARMQGSSDRKEG